MSRITSLQLKFMMLDVLHTGVSPVVSFCNKHVQLAAAFFTRDSIYAIARICHGNSVCLSVRPSHGWISQKRLKLGSRNFHHTVAHPSSFSGVSFIEKF